MKCTPEERAEKTRTSNVDQLVVIAVDFVGCFIVSISVFAMSMSLIQRVSF